MANNQKTPLQVSAAEWERNFGPIRDWLATSVPIYGLNQLGNAFNPMPAVQDLMQRFPEGPGPQGTLRTMQENLSRGTAPSKVPTASNPLSTGAGNLPLQGTHVPLEQQIPMLPSYGGLQPEVPPFLAQPGGPGAGQLLGGAPIGIPPAPVAQQNQYVPRTPEELLGPLSQITPDALASVLAGRTFAQASAPPSFNPLMLPMTDGLGAFALTPQLYQQALNNSMTMQEIDKAMRQQEWANQMAQLQAAQGMDRDTVERNRADLLNRQTAAQTEQMVQQTKNFETPSQQRLADLQSALHLAGTKAKWDRDTALTVANIKAVASGREFTDRDKIEVNAAVDGIKSFINSDEAKTLKGDMSTEEFMNSLLSGTVKLRTPEQQRQVRSWTNVLYRHGVLPELWDLGQPEEAPQEDLRSAFEKWRQARQ